jgi:predicted DNA-binding transcriptional regulator AlpA
VLAAFLLRVRAFPHCEEASVPRHVNEHLTADELKVLSIRECAALNGISWMTLKRRIKAGDGPRIIQISPKRIGVRVIDNAKWQASRLRT